MPGKGGLMSSDYLGQGLKFPFGFERLRGTLQVSTSASVQHEHIRESILQILQTTPGERMMNPEFGSRLNELVFENNTDVLKSLLRYHIKAALDRWEKRIEVSGIEFPEGSPDENALPVKISYRIIRSQVEGNLVYPFEREGV